MKASQEIVNIDVHKLLFVIMVWVLVCYGEPDIIDAVIKYILTWSM